MELTEDTYNEWKHGLRLPIARYSTQEFALFEDDGIELKEGETIHDYAIDLITYKHLDIKGVYGNKGAKIVVGQVKAKRNATTNPDNEDIISADVFRKLLNVNKMKGDIFLALNSKYKNNVAEITNTVISVLLMRMVEYTSLALDKQAYAVIQQNIYDWYEVKQKEIPALGKTRVIQNGTKIEGIQSKGILQLELQDEVPHFLKDNYRGSIPTLQKDILLRVGRLPVGYARNDDNRVVCDLLEVYAEAPPEEESMLETAILERLKVQEQRDDNEFIGEDEDLITKRLLGDLLLLEIYLDPSRRYNVDYPKSVAGTPKFVKILEELLGQTKVGEEMSKIQQKVKLDVREVELL